MVFTTYRLLDQLTKCLCVYAEKKNYSNNEKTAPKKKHFFVYTVKVELCASVYTIHICGWICSHIQDLITNKNFITSKVTPLQGAAAAALHLVFFFILYWFWSVSVIINRISTLISVVKRILILDNYWLNLQITLYLTFWMDTIHWVDA